MRKGSPDEPDPSDDTDPLIRRWLKNADELLESGKKAKIDGEEETPRQI